MQRSALLAAFLVLAVALPAEARHTHGHSHAKALVAKVTLPLAQPAQVAASSKGTRLIAQTPTVSKPHHAAKAAVAKSDKVVKSAPVVATSPASPAAVPVTTPAVPQGRLARLTAYWTEEDPWTAKHESSTGVRLQQDRSCAVDPKLIPYGSLIQIPGMGNYVAVDTGSAVISRQAAICGRTKAERQALVVDLFFENRKDAENFAAHGPAYAAVTWSRPIASVDSPLNPRALPAIPTLPAGAVYVLAQAPTLADCRMPLAFRTPQL